MSRLLSLAHLSAIDLPPPELIHTAADVGFGAVGLRLIRVTETSPGYALMDDAAMMRATRAAIQATGLKVHDIEFIKIEPHTDVAALERVLDAGAELGATEVITAPYDPDLGRLADRLADLTERANARGLGVVLEFFPWTVVPTLKAALDVVTAAGPTVGILPDSLHFDRSPSRLDTLRTLAPERLRFAHLCDAPVHPPYSTEDLLFAGRAERLAPGEGQIDLASFVNALPCDLPLALEVPMTALASAEGPKAVIERIMSSTRRFLNGLTG
ncbi:sugar phosphate isomerase/epimerase [Thalassobius vesicularis]|uniref:Sugar phosphate isomerase/epimerase n=1 Tax=Thalassobius vesicularis TaxID=1294297 RepID=A0A4V3UZ11_9RHOB|nr:sugar phosphate isomerase/epimerase [Thalassobius vesicularis]THD73947.1 sugar phosphate isomerase/epimerase [Thalassobius vesicularis]